MSLTNAILFNQNNVFNKISAVNIWGPTFIKPFNMFNVACRNLTDVKIIAQNCNAYSPGTNVLVNAPNTLQNLYLDVYDCTSGFLYNGFVTNGNQAANTTFFCNIDYSQSRFGIGFKVGSNKVKSLNLYLGGVGKVNSDPYNGFFNNTFKNTTSLENLNIWLPNYQYNNNRLFVGAEIPNSLKSLGIFANKAEQVPLGYNIFTHTTTLETFEGYFPSLINGHNMFYQCKGNINLHNLGINYQNLQHARDMFRYANGLSGEINDLFIGNKDILIPTSAQNYAGMFFGCNNITGVNNVTIYGHNLGAIFASTNLKYMRNCGFFGNNIAVFYQQYSTNLTDLEDISIGRLQCTQTSSVYGLYPSSNKIANVKNIIVNLPGNNGVFVNSALFANQRFLTSPSNTIFYDATNNEYINTYTTPPSWLTGYTTMNMFRNCVNMPDYDLVANAWKNG